MRLKIRLLVFFHGLNNEVRLGGEDLLIWFVISFWWLSISLDRRRRAEDGRVVSILSELGVRGADEENARPRETEHKKGA